jgi:hypothetical protein
MTDRGWQRLGGHFVWNASNDTAWKEPSPLEAFQQSVQDEYEFYKDHRDAVGTYDYGDN